ncbi:type I-B CRISPR-associated protein Cas8b1/Cst1 [Thermoflavimicrobium daqui]|uniref:CRISPR-associated protein CXXC-CXXC domain-containing protein n=1 Tax=Thermoflavimicrobium daqui TaxID=2137476 RepID=A0A364K7B6_9BACL|nr:type I-B CRISPR-associated protein Cas8b1/Cst1 [Thermoflavimicrobium daqui]RAL26189.1 hypothetical protein DL897_04110 [Thermoflavimicrobium daqui]
MRFKLYLNDWFVNAGILGFLKVLSRYEDESLYQMGPNYIECDSRILETFAEKFFEVLLEKYSKYEQDKKQLTLRLQKAKSDPKQFTDQRNKTFDLVKSTIDKLKKKVERGYLSESVLIELKRLHEKKKETKSIEELETVIQQYLEIISMKDVEESLTINLIRAEFMKLYGQPSFLNPSFQGITNDFIHRFKEDFMIPVMQELDFIQWIQNRDLELIEKDLKKEKARSKCFSDQYKLYRKVGEILPCSLLEERFPGTLQLEEMHFSPLGISAKIENVFWNGKESTYISHLARLILFCIPLGVCAFDRQEKGYNQSSNEWQRIYTFVNADTSIRQLKKINDEFVLRKDRDHPFSELIYDLLQETEKKSIWTLQNIMFVEFYGEGKNTQLNYFHISKRIAEFFSSKNSKDLEQIRYASFRNQVIQAILDRKDPMGFIERHLRQMIQEGRSAWGCQKALQARYKLNQMMQGEQDVDARRLKKVFDEGKEISHYFHKNDRANQLAGLSYRLLNACKAGNKNQFYDSILRIYISMGREIPPSILNIFHEQDLSFEEWGYSFISGLQSYENNNKEEQDHV